MSAQKVVAVFGAEATLPGSQEWDEARDVGFRLAQAGIAVITGGYGGTMEAASRGAAEGGGHVIGVTAPAMFPDRDGANPFVMEEVQTATLADRLGALFGPASGVIALPGSIGTATELLLAWNTNHIVRRHGGSRLPSVAVGAVWGSVANELVASLNALGSDIHHADSGAQAVDWMLEQLENP